VKESRDRVRAALVNSRFEFPARRITVNLAPAELPKESGRYDLPSRSHPRRLAPAPGRRLPEYEFAESSPDRELRPVRGALAMTWRAARDGAHSSAAASAYEAALVSEASIYQADRSRCLRSPGRRQPLARRQRTGVIPPNYPDLAEVKGQAQAKRALEVAAAGGHSVLMVGPPERKVDVAARFPGLLPPMSGEERSNRQRSARSAQAASARELETAPVPRAAHTASSVALVGGGSDPRPGRSRSRTTACCSGRAAGIQSQGARGLREPLESGRVAISRAAPGGYRRGSS